MIYSFVIEINKRMQDCYCLTGDSLGSTMLKKQQHAILDPLKKSKTVAAAGKGLVALEHTDWCRTRY